MKSAVTQNTTLTLGEIAAQLSAELIGDSSVVIEGLATLATAQSGQLSFLANPSYRRQLSTTLASAVIVNRECAAQCPTNTLIVNNPYLAYASLSHKFDRAPMPFKGVHPSAVVHPTAQLSEGVCVGANAVVEENVHLGSNVVIGSGCVIGASSVIGDYSVLKSNVTLYHRVKIGHRVTIHSGAVIGSDGFGFANDKGAWKKIAQLGSVVIGDDVDVGANTTIDRGALDDTVIGNGVIIDNQVQIAHNVKIGEFTAIAGCVGIAGSTTIGRYCTLAGAAGVAGHLNVCDKVHIGMQAQVTSSIDTPGSYASGTGLMPTDNWRRSVIRFRQLNELYRRFVKWERNH